MSSKLEYNDSSHNNLEYKDNDEDHVVFNSESKTYSNNDKYNSKDIDDNVEQNDNKSNLLQKVQEYFYENEELALSFERFIAEHSYIIDLTTDEYKLEYTEVFIQYKALFERKMEDYITNTLNASIYDFYRLLKAKTEEEDDNMYVESYIYIIY